VDELFTQLQERLQERPGRALNLPGVLLRESAVLVPLFIRHHVPHALFTKRPTTLRSHPGQISFPGGARDPEDLTPVHTALRETHEELGVPPEQVQVLGMLDEIPTVTRYRILPFVGAIPHDVRYVPNVAEIDQVIEVPLPHLLDPARRRTERRPVLGRERDVYFYDYGEHVIWGATAHILTNLLNLAADLPAIRKLGSR
jgi:8-oxo-dGTP pyrophosphatase MutT (NUDIX family)